MVIIFHPHLSCHAMQISMQLATKVSVGLFRLTVFITPVLQDEVITLGIPTTPGHNMGETFSSNDVYKF